MSAALQAVLLGLLLLVAGPAQGAAQPGKNSIGTRTCIGAGRCSAVGPCPSCSRCLVPPLLPPPQACRSWRGRAHCCCCSGFWLVPPCTGWRCHCRNALACRRIYTSWCCWLWHLSVLHPPTALLLARPLLLQPKSKACSMPRFTRWACRQWDEPERSINVLRMSTFDCAAEAMPCVGPPAHPTCCAFACDACLLLHRIVACR